MHHPPRLWFFLVIALVSCLSGCRQPLCRTAVGEFAVNRRLRLFSTSCTQQGEACVITYVPRQGDPDVPLTATLSCKDGDCKCVGSCEGMSETP